MAKCIYASLTRDQKKNHSSKHWSTHWANMERWCSIALWKRFEFEIITDFVLYSSEWFNYLVHRVNFGWKISDWKDPLFPSSRLVNNFSLNLIVEYYYYYRYFFIVVGDYLLDFSVTKKVKDHHVQIFRMLWYATLTNHE